MAHFNLKNTLEIADGTKTTGIALKKVTLRYALWMLVEIM